MSKLIFFLCAAFFGSTVCDESSHQEYVKELKESSLSDLENIVKIFVDQKKMLDNEIATGKANLEGQKAEKFRFANAKFNRKLQNMKNEIVQLLAKARNEDVTECEKLMKNFEEVETKAITNFAECLSSYMAITNGRVDYLYKEFDSAVESAKKAKQEAEVCARDSKNLATALQPGGCLYKALGDIEKFKRLKSEDYFVFRIKKQYGSSYYDSFYNLDNCPIQSTDGYAVINEIRNCVREALF